MINRFVAALFAIAIGIMLYAAVIIIGAALAGK